MIVVKKELWYRLEKLESICRKMETELCNHIQYLADASQSREKLRQEFRTFYVERFKELEKKTMDIIKDSSLPAISSLNSRIEILEGISNSKSRRPHKCPVCCGGGNIYADEIVSVPMQLDGWKINSAGIGFKQCHSCKGEGIVWG